MAKKEKKVEPEEPKLKKNALFMLSSNHNSRTKQMLKDLYQISKPNAVFRVNKKSEYEWQDVNLKLQVNQKNHRIAESICAKVSCGLYLVANSNKKRPINLGLGRIYDRKILDCCQLRVEKYVSVEEIGHLGSVKHNSRPLVVVQGSEFGQDSGPLNTVRDIFLDVFRGPSFAKLSLENVEHAIVLTVVDGDSYAPELTLDAVKGALDGESLDVSNTDSSNAKEDVGDAKDESAGKAVQSPSGESAPKILFRHYSIQLLKSDDPKVPYVKLSELGPSIDFVLEGVVTPDPEVFKDATKVEKRPKKLISGVDTQKTAKKSKNVKSTSLGNIEGKVYINRQNLDTLYTPHKTT
ncbi:hypothetical protein BEWA_001750 [Theileria equi strain WA]|uniref:Ribosome production factor 2 homolog n=1 Tax=Theileria equi strain WA TaxID=1537102 RepID=L0AZT0_THEEQ|nr:hypothetical protein BEWA_001750 [Theileria equi strain WA]AFZ80768.1 hypothetical protein BEWA_001750 [Theileria equi strain WA]|eukprot:XP_004830434.1 hypothetical protein BEWA_001750 [Theileria equi strain WA]